VKNISQYIVDYLKSYKKVSIPGFGVFTVEFSGAKMDDEKKSILPPSQFVLFSQNFEESDNSIASYISLEKIISVSNALHELQTQTDFWKKKIAAKEEFSIENLGSFVKEDTNLVFKGERLSSDSPYFFGLEEIVFSEIQNKKSGKTIENSDKEYQFSKSVLWIFLLIIPLFLIAYFAYTNQELLFGKKSFEDISIKNSTHRIEKIKKQIPTVVDSLKTDSVKVAP
jgi:hypothetical protein